FPDQSAEFAGNGIILVPERLNFHFPKHGMSFFHPETVGGAGCHLPHEQHPRTPADSTSSPASHREVDRDCSGQCLSTQWDRCPPNGSSSCTLFHSIVDILQE